MSVKIERARKSFLCADPTETKKGKRKKGERKKGERKKGEKGRNRSVLK